MKRLYKNKEAQEIAALYFLSTLQEMHRNHENTDAIAVDKNPDKVYAKDDAIELLFEEEFAGRFDWMCSERHHNRYFQVYCGVC